jgi:hypothetical protein
MEDVEHLLVAQAGTEEGSRYVVMVGVRVDDLESITKVPADAAAIDVLRDLALEIQIVFSSKQKLNGFGPDWQYALLTGIARQTFNPRRSRPEGYPLRVHLPYGLPVESDWLDPYLTGATYGLIRVRTEVVHHDDRLLWLARFVAHTFHEAIEEDVARSTAARHRYDALAPLVAHIEDVGLNVSYSRGGTAFEALVKASLSS